MYAIVGVTGHVGGVVAEILLQKNLPVKAIVRNNQKEKEWENRGAETAFALLTDSDALGKAFEGASGIFIMTPPLLNSDSPMREHNEMLAALKSAIEKSKPDKIVYLSSVGAHLERGTGAIRKLFDMENTFRELSIPTVGIRAAWFMENFTGMISVVRESGKLPSFLNPTEMAIPMIAACDIGKLAADLLLANWTGHRIIELEGPCSYSADDAATIIGYHLDKPVNAVAIDESEYAATCEFFGCTAAAALLMAEMNTGFNTGLIAFQNAGAEHLTGETLLEDVLKDYI